jgi:putative ATPase
MEFFGRAQSAPESEEQPGTAERDAPLAERMRPRAFDEWVGQRELTGKGGLLRRLLEGRALPSLIFWGPPGCGKTTLARLLASESGQALATLSAVTAGIKDAKALIEQARARSKAGGRRTILFIDEIHRFNRAQQDAFLPHVEAGTITLFGATTENPSFSIVAPLLSRCRVLTLEALEVEDLIAILRRALADKERGLGAIELEICDDTLGAIARSADGDARRALGLLEQCAAAAQPDEGGRRRVDGKLLAEVARRQSLLYDKSGEEHFNLISALHKSVRSSDPQGALYWLARMLAAGEEPLYIGRRLIRMAAEDIGLADPNALPQAIAGVQMFERLGPPEGELGLAQAAVYLATAPKSNALYVAMGAARSEIDKTGARPVPLHFRNAPTGLMKAIGYGAEYQYDHDAPEGFSGQACLPEGLERTEFYSPSPRGFEKEIAERLEAWSKLRAEKKPSAKPDRKRKPA